MKNNTTTTNRKNTTAYHLQKSIDLYRKATAETRKETQTAEDLTATAKKIVYSYYKYACIKRGDTPQLRYATISPDNFYDNVQEVSLSIVELYKTIDPESMAEDEIRKLVYKTGYKALSRYIYRNQSDRGTSAKVNPEYIGRRAYDGENETLAEYENENEAYISYATQLIDLVMESGKSPATLNACRDVLGLPAQKATASQRQWARKVLAELSKEIGFTPTTQTQTQTQTPGTTYTRTDWTGTEDESEPALMTVTGEVIPVWYHGDPVLDWMENRQEPRPQMVTVETLKQFEKRMKAKAEREAEEARQRKEVVQLIRKLSELYPLRKDY